MYCPQCSQQQVSEEMRFCSRCGFGLGSVMQLVGIAPVSSKPAKKREKPSAIKGAKLGTWIIVASLAHALLAGLFTAMDDDFFFLLLISLSIFVIGFSRLLYAVFVQERREAKEIEAHKGVPLLSAQVPGAVFQPLGVPVDSFTRPIKKTAEVVQPPSVTENTTRFLDDEKDSQLQRNSQ